jgi:hypothetical protein
MDFYMLLMCGFYSHFLDFTKLSAFLTLTNECFKKHCKYTDFPEIFLDYTGFSQNSPDRSVLKFYIRGLLPSSILSISYDLQDSKVTEVSFKT